MTTSKRVVERKSARFQGNIARRGSVPETVAKKGDKYPVSTIVIIFFVFVVVGSALFQIIRNAQTRSVD
ncbi:unnamed protein product [Closterium sp. Naga37s-1]|nr:unnamed protein product [Closterium sp. Naga37s-1]